MSKHNKQSKFTCFLVWLFLTKWQTSSYFWANSSSLELWVSDLVRYHVNPEVIWVELNTHIPVHQCKTARTNWVFFLFSGICSFFFFTGKIKIAEDAAPSLNYYWVPILVSKLEFYQSSNTRFSICKIKISIFQVVITSSPFIYRLWCLAPI